MENNVLITVCARQNYMGQEPETIELTTEGCLRREGERLMLSYEESELTGLSGTTTEFEICPDHVILRRTGTAHSVMEFRLGQTARSLYDAGAGTLLLTITTTKIVNHLDETGGNLQVAYAIEIEELGMGEIEYDLVVTER